MKTTKEKADAIYSKFEDEIIGLEGQEWYDSALKCAILSVKHTIEVLQSLKLEIIYNGYYEQTPNLETEIEYSIRTQTELLTELESRL